MAYIAKQTSRILTGALLLAISQFTSATAAKPVAVIGDITITYQTLEQHVKGELIELEHERYEILRNGLYDIIGEHLVSLAAEAKDQTPEQFLASEVEAKTEKPDAELVQEVYTSNKQHFADTPAEEAMKEVTEYLVEQSRQKRYQEVMTSLESQYALQINLLPPVIDVGSGDRPSLGNASAPITLIEFSDYECTYCKTAEPVVQKILQAYGDKIRFVYRDYPLDFHANARPAAQAARCAEQQGQFWPYHVKLMASQQLHRQQYQAIADTVGLDREQFDACLESDDFNAAIDRDVADGEAAGVSGTPAFFINGRMISGAQPFARFKALIDKELLRVSDG